MTLILLCISIIISLCGCSFGKTKVVWTGAFASNQVFKMDDEVCTIGEINIIMANYRNLYLNSYGKELWSRSASTSEYSLEAYIKDTALNQLSKMTCMNLLAKERKVQLSSAEDKQVEEASTQYYDSLSKEEISELKINKDDIRKLYGKYALSTKLYSELTVGVNEEVSDDDARIMHVMQIVVSSSTKASKISEKLEQGTDFTSLANLYNEQQQIETFVSRTEVPSNVERTIFTMDNDQISPCIEAEKKFYFYKVLDKFDKEKTDANKIVIVQNRARTAFDNVYEDFSQKVKANLNDALWDDYKLHYSEAIKTEQFFQIFDKYLGELKKSR
ncbi:MAG: peptidyl-prolyl cis-trans isomerase [Lachnospiraceae bacterium]|nr:peptidyl-prolyl cis-trans isomerase [Lachnospiraceae bacterium]